MEQLGKGFIKFKDGKLQITEKDRENAEESLQYAKEKINSSKYDMIILDEINNILAYELIDIADTVSEIRKIKHAYSKGVKAKKGIEY